MSTPRLFCESEMIPAPRSATAEVTPGAPRLLEADRKQLRLGTIDLEASLAADHRARAMWDAVGQLDLSVYYAAIEARGSSPGRPAIDPKILLSLWLYATSEGVGSARQVARLCERDDAYRWICGGVSVNHHTLSDFRVARQEALDDLLTQVLAVMMRQGLVTLKRVAQDGMRVRASAGAASFRREGSLKDCLKQARAQVERTKAEMERPDVQRSAREQAAAERAVREREERVQRALAELPKAREAKDSEKARENARVSTTDAEARVMKMADGGFRPGYNVQLATDTESRVIVGVTLTNVGSDGSQLEPMLADVERRTGRTPEQYLVDGGFTKLEAIENASERGVEVYAPPPTPRKEGVDPYKAKATDSAAVAQWRERMGTPEAKEIYKHRASTAESVNADLRHWRRLDKLPVRGHRKVLALVLWAALAYNLARLYPRAP